MWIVDPLDGTRNYASGIPFFSLGVGLALDGEVLVGLNYDPMRQEIFHAEKGNGAFLNDEPIRVSERSMVEESILGMDMSYNDEGAVNGLSVILALWPGRQTARIMGSSALGISDAAAGRTDIYYPPPVGALGPGGRHPAGGGSRRRHHRPHRHASGLV